MQFFGEAAFIAARQPVLAAMEAMQQAGWLAANTSVEISMLDARGDFAQFDGERCLVHVNIDEQGSSPIVAALGNLRSSLAFVAAHELAHCRFDTAPISERFPDRQQLTEMGIGSHLTTTFLKASRHPNAKDGSESFMVAYDESLADAAAAIALVKAETAQQHFGTALEKAQSLRFGELFMANRGAIPVAAHQGGFVFDAIASQPIAHLNWRLAKRVAMQSVLASSFYLATEPPWFKTLQRDDRQQAESLQRTWHKKAHQQLATRQSGKDEKLFYEATSDALLSINGSQFPVVSDDASPEDALQRWKEIAWISSDSNLPIPKAMRANFKHKSLLQAIVSKHEPAP
jgi:hypothetical protein